MSHRLSRNWRFGWSRLLPVAVFTFTSMGQQKSSASRPKFDVTSVKPCKVNAWGTNGGETNMGRLTVHCEAVVNLVRRAYSVFRDGKINERGRLTKIEGGPAWAYSDLYEIEAKADSRQAAGVMEGPMMQSLLEDRFKLKVHLETRDVPVYALTVAKGGIKSPVAKQGCFLMGASDQRTSLPNLPPAELRLLRCGHADTRNHEFHLHGAAMADLSDALSLMPFDRRFIDKTGVTGQFDFDFKLALLDQEESGAAIPVSGQERLFAAYQTALGKLGLKIDSSRGPGEFLIIDHLERPSMN